MSGADADLHRPSTGRSPLCAPSLLQRLDALVRAQELTEPESQSWSFPLQLAGHYGFGVQDPSRGADLGLATRVRARVRLMVEVLPEAVGSEPRAHAARLTGTFRSGALGGARPVRRGVALVLRTGQPESVLLGYQLHLSGWENVPVTVRGQLCRTPAAHLPALARQALSLELWRDASADGSEPEQLIATGILHLSPVAALRAAVEFWRSAPPGAQPGRRLGAVLRAGFGA